MVARLYFILQTVGHRLHFIPGPHPFSTHSNKIMKNLTFFFFLYFNEFFVLKCFTFFLHSDL